LACGITAPDASVTSPVTDPVTVCALAKPAESQSNIISPHRNAVQRKVFVVIVNLSCEATVECIHNCLRLSEAGLKMAYNNCCLS
jgi:hypothetical protein